VHVEEDEDGERKQKGEQTVGNVFVDDVVDGMRRQTEVQLL